MSTAEEHDSPIKTPRQLITVVVLAFVVPILVIVLLVMFVTSKPRGSAGADAMSAEAIETRIAPVAGFQLAAAGGGGGGGELRTGEAVYKAQCGTCHANGLAGAPKLGDTAAWAPRIKTGYEALLTSALKGKGAMAAQGGGDYKDIEIGRAVVYMANQAGGKLEEPKAPAAGGGDAKAAAAPAPAAAAAAPAAAAAAAPKAEAPKAEAKPAADAPKQAAAGNGKATYDGACMACHAAGVAGAPKFGDKAAWEPRLAAGIDGLTASVIKGKGAMPPRGASSASDADIHAAVEYMVAAVK